MGEAATRLKANLRLQGQPCTWCAEPLNLGDDAAVCGACGACAHGWCWDGGGGCATAGCANAPLKQIRVNAVAAAARPGYQLCPGCGREIAASEQLCPHCHAIATPDGLYHGPRVNAPGAAAALTWSLVGLLVCGMILGAVALSKASAARKLIKTHPQYGGTGLVTAATIIGIVDIVGWLAGLVLRVSAIH